MSFLVEGDLPGMMAERGDEAVGQGEDIYGVFVVRIMLQFPFFFFHVVFPLFLEKSLNFVFFSKQNHREKTQTSTSFSHLSFSHQAGSFTHSPGLPEETRRLPAAQHTQTKCVHHERQVILYLELGGLSRMLCACLMVCIQGVYYCCLLSPQQQHGLPEFLNFERY